MDFEIGMDVCLALALCVAIQSDKGLQIKSVDMTPKR